MKSHKKIVRRSNVAPTSSWGQSLHPKIRDIYASRGISSDDDLDRSLTGLIDWRCMKGIKEGAALLADALMQHQKILIVGDFDADGATSTAVSKRALEAMGARYVNFLVPNRFEFGYGLTPELVAIALEDKPDLIMTVDNGIASHAGVLAAKNAGIKVLVTDHHLAAETLPQADAIINPNQPGDDFPSKALAGVGVAFYTMLALRHELGERDWFEGQAIKKPNMAAYLDIVALGTVADVVPLDKNNRLLVAQGLARIRAGKCVAGIKALLDVAKKIINNVSSQDLGFAVAPRLNAAGRMDDMAIGIECLLADDENQAQRFAFALDELNQERKAVEGDMQIQVMQDLKRLHLSEKKQLPVAMCLFDASWHQGVIGILASRVKDKVHRAVVAFACDGDELIKGSCRSIPGLHIRDVLAEVDARKPGLIVKFGGHAMAAGLGIAKKDFQVFKDAFEAVVSDHVQEKDLQGTIDSDGELDVTDFTLRFAEILQEAGPWGQAFPAPLFDGKFKIINQRLLGGKHLKLTLGLQDSDVLIDAIAFNVDNEQWPNDRCKSIYAAYRLDINEFRGRRSVQLIIEQLEAVRVHEAMLS